MFYLISEHLSEWGDKGTPLLLTESSLTIINVMSVLNELIRE
jgi:hypothetical protein